jgi:beta-lactam-binding protein with PASTA domain
MKYKYELIGAIVFVVLVAFVVFYIVTAPTEPEEQRQGEEIVMPNLIGLDFDSALVLHSYLTFNTPNMEHSSEYERGRIMSQSVLAGRPVREGHLIDISVSMGPRLAELNNYEGGVLHIDEVLSRLQRQGFSQDKIRIQNEESFVVPSGFVIRTDPGAGTMISLDSNVTVFVSIGGMSEMTQTPDLIGLTRTQAEERAGMHDVVLVFIEEYNEHIAADRIISQSPLPMVALEKFSTVEVIVSAGPAPAKSFLIHHEVTSNRTGDFLFEHYIDGILQEDLNRTQNIGLNRVISWEVEGTGVQNLAIFITSVETSRRLLFAVYEVDFTGNTPSHRITEFNDRIFSELSVPLEPDPQPPEHEEPEPEPAD